MKGQDNLVLNGAQVLDVGNSAGAVNVSSLPAPGIPDTYNGTVPSFSQNVQYDEDGDLLFFVIDGAVYDKEGYLIADNALTANCQECLFEGITQAVVTQVPGSCSQYYIVAGKKLGGDIHGLGYSILDLSWPNPHWTGRSGRVLSYDDVTNDTQLNAQFGSSVQNMFSWGMHNNSSFQGISQCMIDLQEEEINSFGYEWALHLALYDTDDLTNEKKLLFAVDEASIIYYEVKNTGIDKQSTLTAGDLINGAASSFGYGTRRPYAGSCAFGKDLNGNILFAMSKTELTEVTSTGMMEESIHLMKVNFNGTLEWLGDIMSTPPGIFQPLHISSMAFDQTGSYLYFSQDRGPRVGAIDLSTLSYVDIETQLSIVNSSDFEYGYVSLNKEPNSSNLAMYVRGGNRISAILSPELGPGATFLDPVVLSGTLNTAPQSHYNTVIPLELPDANNWQEQQTVNLLEPVCCSYTTENDAITGYSSTTSNTFYPASNPWNLGSVVHFSDDVRVQSGHSITVNNMTWRFAPGKSLIIEAGASLTFNNGTLTSWQCDNMMWEGVRVGGNSSNTSQNSTSQGRLLLNNSEISNATIGARTQGIDATGAVIPNSTGGRIRAVSSTFKNNIQGVYIDRYHRFIGNNEYPNLSGFFSCIFITDTNWPSSSQTPLHQAWLQDVNGIRFNNCSFRNDAISSFSTNQRGIGIYAFDATFKCEGYMQYAMNRFEGLSAGVISIAPDPAFTYEVDGMAFENNAYYGILDLQGTDMYITNNQFKTNTTDLLPNNQTSVGAYLWSSEGYVFERNTFEKDAAALTPGVGVWFRGPAFQDNQIYDNSFDGLNGGCVVDGIHVGQSSTGGNTVPGLQLLCGDYGTTVPNAIDCALLPINSSSANYRHDQGLPASPANNRFFTTRPSAGPEWDVVTWPGLDPVLVDIQYHYFDWTGGADPEMRPEWIHDLAFNPLSYVDDYYDLLRMLSPVQFDKSANCDEGNLDGSGGGQIIQMVQEYQTRIQELNSAILNYQGVVDGGEPVDLMAMIEFADPWHPSHALRDEMLNQAPLSDEVMLAAIWREQAMDPWHLTQVLINNSELSNEIWIALEESQALSAFYINYLKQYDQEQSMRALFEQEITLRQQQMSAAQRAIIHHFATDTIVPDPQDSIDHYLSMDPSESGTRLRYWLAIEQGNESLASNLSDELIGRKANEDLLTLGSLYTAVDNDLSSFNSTQFIELQVIADASDSYGAALAYGLLHANEQRNDMPYAVLPPELRSSLISTEDRAFTDIELLAAYPNPATDRVMITYPKELQTGYLELFDAQGKLIDRVSLSDQIGFVEFDLRNREAGLYLAQLVFEGMNMAQTKFTVVK